MAWGTRIVTTTSSIARKFGAALDSLGATLEVAKYTDRLVPSTRFVAYDGVAPIVSEAASFVAPNASVIGDVSIGSNSSVWYGATLRGDVRSITIGNHSSVGDRAVLHGAKMQSDHTVVVGNHVTIGAGAVIHACTLLDSCVVGPSAQVLDGSVVKGPTVIAAGALVTPGTKIEGGSVWAGSPAKEQRKLTEAEIADIYTTSEDTAQLAALHAIECAKDADELMKDEEAYEDLRTRDEEYFQPNAYGDDDVNVLGQGAPGRIFDTTLSHPERAHERNSN